jgi:hypothetical protein
MQSLKQQYSSVRIDEYLNTYMVMNLIQQPKRESWTYACLRKYYAHHYNKYHTNTMLEEMHTPNLRTIEEVNDKISKLGMFFDQTKVKGRRKCAKIDLDEVP